MHLSFTKLRLINLEFTQVESPWIKLGVKQTNLTCN